MKAKWKKLEKQIRARLWKALKAMLGKLNSIWSLVETVPGSC